MQAIAASQVPVPQSAFRGLLIAVLLELAAGGLGLVTLSLFPLA